MRSRLRLNACAQNCMCLGPISTRFRQSPSRFAHEVLIEIVNVHAQAKDGNTAWRDRAARRLADTHHRRPDSAGKSLPPFAPPRGHCRPSLIRPICNP